MARDAIRLVRHRFAGMSNLPFCLGQRPSQFVNVREIRFNLHHAVQLLLGQPGLTSLGVSESQMVVVERV